MSLPPALSDRLTLPLIAAPMFLVSGVRLVIEACRAGAIGSFPTINCRSAAELDAWMGEIADGLADQAGWIDGRRPAPACPNLIVHRTNARLAEDVAVLAERRVELVIASVGSPEPVLEPLHAVGALVFADVASIRHAEKAVAAGADGLILLTAGAGGQTGWANPFAFVRAVRRFWDGPLVLAGGVSDGAALYAARALGCDLAYMGTRFIATQESMAKDAYKRMLVDAGMDDILLTRAFTGLETNMLKPSIRAAGLDPGDLPAKGALDAGESLSVEAREKKPARWRDIWSAGHSVSGVDDVPRVVDLVARTRDEYAAARESARSISR